MPCRRRKFGRTKGSRRTPSSSDCVRPARSIEQRGQEQQVSSGAITSHRRRCLLPGAAWRRPASLIGVAVAQRRRHVGRPKASAAAAFYATDSARVKTRAQKQLCSTPATDPTKAPIVRLGPPANRSESRRRSETLRWTETPTRRRTAFLALGLAVRRRRARHGPGLPLRRRLHGPGAGPAVNAGAGMPGAGGEDVGFGVPHSAKTDARRRLQGQGGTSRAAPAQA